MTWRWPRPPSRRTGRHHVGGSSRSRLSIASPRPWPKCASRALPRSMTSAPCSSGSRVRRQGAVSHSLFHRCAPRHLAAGYAGAGPLVQTQRFPARPGAGFSAYAHGHGHGMYIRARTSCVLCTAVAARKSAWRAVRKSVDCTRRSCLPRSRKWPALRAAFSTGPARPTSATAGTAGSAGPP